MYLSSIEVQGFKTFAQKTQVKMPSPVKDHRPTTIIVGPNGSGKSNMADAVRWCLGEQSLKQLRGKKHEDVIFSGSTGKGRSGFAEVTMNFEAEKEDKTDFTSVAITRRLDRTGDSKYLLNGRVCRLQDIQLFLAEHGIGQRSYSVIGQGMVDHILTASPEERKVFFDDATGVRSLQIKRHQTWLKLKRSHTHLEEVMRLLEEMEPRLRLLKRQVNRLAEKEEVEVELKKVQEQYFGSEWRKSSEQITELKEQIEAAKGNTADLDTELKETDAELDKMQRALIEKTKHAESRIKEEQEVYRNLQHEVSKAEREVIGIEREIELARVRFQTSWAPLPLTDIVNELESIYNLEKEVTEIIKSPDFNPGTAAKQVESLFGKIKELHKKLIKPNKEDFKVDTEIEAKLTAAQKSVEEAKTKLATHEGQNAEKTKEAARNDDENKAFLELQQKSRQIQRNIHEREQQAHRIDIELAKAQTQKESLIRELHEIAPHLENHIREIAPNTDIAKNAEELRAKMLKLIHKRDMIGGIEDGIEEEFKEVSEKYGFLKEQSDDLDEAIKNAKKLIKELDGRIEEQSEKVFKEIRKAFKKYFEILFGGGSCDLVQLTDEPHEDEEENDTALGRALEALAEDETHKLDVDKSGHITGVEINATPPGKKMKSLNLLSGGEKAMTSIALLCAIMSVNPSPFVVLDEVDAALDEANTMRFASILQELRKHSQFVVITHNRATMEQADILYGVTMNDDGVSQLLSVKLNDIAEGGTTRR